MVLDAARTPPVAPILAPQKGQGEYRPLKHPKGPLKINQDHVMPYVDPRKGPHDPNQDWGDGEGYFGSEHTLILIICLSAIATMLVFILFIMLAWLRRRSAIAARRSTNPAVAAVATGPGGMKRVFVDGSQFGGGGTLLAAPPVWGDESSAKDESSSGLSKRASPVYWLKAAGNKGTLDGKNVSLCLWRILPLSFYF